MSGICWNTKIVTGERNEEPVLRAAKSLERDIQKCCLRIRDEESEKMFKTDIRLKNGNQADERYILRLEDGNLVIESGSTMGFVYGLYGVSEKILGVQPFWFWNDQKMKVKAEYRIPEDFFYESRPFAVRLRGWFVNDEVLIHTWNVDRRKDAPWEMVFEALLRCGGNLVIPGTDKNSILYRRLASDMGLAITHHHSEPLGSEMFARAYPDLTPSFAKYPEKFRRLWQDGIEAQQGMNVVWNIGFRGQGDVPFWNDDPRYDTKEARGKLMSSLTKEQYDMVKAKDPHALCCTNLYGETMELYREGYLKLPEDVIKIWADNGFGKMVTRRQENHNPRIPALPEKGEKGKEGIYYHVSFYDLQAANHMTMLPNSPEFIKSELKKVLERGADSYWLINCSNVKPHVYYLDFIARMWQAGDVDVEKHREKYFSTYYGDENAGILCKIHRTYFKYALSYGAHEDDHAGEQFSNHVARILIHQYVKDRSKRAEDLLWATDAGTLEEQVEWYRMRCEEAVNNYSQYMRECEEADALITEEGRTLYRDSLFLQAQLHYECYQGALEICRSLSAGIMKKYQKSFYHAGMAQLHYKKADAAMRSREHGKWHEFYANECLTDMKQTAWVIAGLMSYVRNLGDGPHYYQWQRDFLYAEEDRRVMLVMNMENHLTDEELFRLMREKWER